MFGLEMIFAMTFSSPRFSVLQEPQSAAPASQMPCSSRWDPMVTTATGLFASPEWKSPLAIGHPLAGDFFSAIFFTSNQMEHQNSCYQQTYSQPIEERGHTSRHDKGFLPSRE